METDKQFERKMKLFDWGATALILLVGLWIGHTATEVVKDNQWRHLILSGQIQIVTNQTSSIIIKK